MAEALGTAASALAVIELAAELAKICTKYISSVRHAQEDISRMRAALVQLQKIFADARQKSIEMGSKLSSTNSMIGLSNDCSSHLNQLLGDLKIPTGRRWASKVVSLKWPLKSETVDKEIYSLDRYCQRMQAALQIDAITLLDDISKDNTLSKLAWAEGATYDAFEDSEEANMTCLDDTRVALLKEIRNWIADPGSKSIFWLCGMAGTGKSTISRTLATELAAKQQLCATFFFKIGEGDRGGAKRFFTTIAAQLTRSIPALAPGVRKALEIDPQIGSKALKEQFEKLILEPLSSIKNRRSTPVVLVIDALDECRPDWHVEIMIGLFSRLRSLQPLQIRIFVTSRPERAPRDGFQDITPAGYQDLILHEIPESIIKHDIAVFLAYQFTRIRKKRIHELAEDWPGEIILSTLTTKSQPLFIYASTICRFIGTGRYPEARLKAVLLDQNNQAYDKVHQTYRPVLDRLLEEHKEAETDQQAMLADFREIVGPIVIMFEPLTMNALGKLINVDIRRIRSTLDDLQSLIHIPTNPDQPVRPLHLSFPDFLLDEERRNTHRFWLDRRELHKALAHRCINILLTADCLSAPDICQLKLPGTYRSDILPSRISHYLPSEVQYACRFWTRHLVESHAEISSFVSSISTFLYQRFLVWFEALSLLGRSSELITMLGHLTMSFENTSFSELVRTIYDARRFVLTNGYIADRAPLQLYSSCIMFAPDRSHIKLRHKLPIWLGRRNLSPEISTAWGPCQQSLIGHMESISSVAFSPDGTILASSSNDCTVKLWHTGSGQLLQTLDHQNDSVISVAFSQDGELLMSASVRGQITLWDTKSGQVLQISSPPMLSVTSAAFSDDGTHLACGMEEGSIQIWQLKSRSFALLQTLVSSGSSITAIAFSPDGSLVAADSRSTAIKLWDVKKWEKRQIFDGCHTCRINSLAISPDGKLMASGLGDGMVGIWDLDSTLFCQHLRLHTDAVTSVAFSPDSKLLVSGSDDRNIVIWDVNSWDWKQVLTDHVRPVTSLAFSAISLASGSLDCTIRLWDIDLDVWDRQVPASRKGPDLETSMSRYEATRIGSESQKFVWSLALSSTGGLVAYGLNDKVMLYETDTSREDRILLDGRSSEALAFSQDGQLLACGCSDGQLQLWNITSPPPRAVASAVSPPQLLHTANKHTRSIEGLAFSADQKLLASSSADGKINILDVASMQVVQTMALEGRSYDISFHGALRQLNTASCSYPIDSSIDYTPSELPESLELRLHGSWVTINRQRLLWLPAEWQNYMHSAVNGQCLAFTTSDVKLAVLEILPEELKRIGLLADKL